MTESLHEIEVSLPQDLYEWASGEVARGRASSVPALCVEGLDALACLRSQRPDGGYAGLDDLGADELDEEDDDDDFDEDDDLDEPEPFDPGRAQRLAQAMREVEEVARKMLAADRPGAP